MSGANSQTHHAIIGDGFVALQFAAAIKLSAGDRLTIIGPGVGRLGRGIAYADDPEDAVWRYAFLLNSPADAIDPDFADWLTENWRDVADLMRGRRPDWLRSGASLIEKRDFAALNAPRPLFGDFLERQAAAVLDRHHRQGVRVELIADRVTEVLRSSGGLSVVTESGTRVKADRVDVATGGPGNQRIDGDDGLACFPHLFGNEAEIVDLLKPGSRVVCIGSNATMLDVLRLCQAVLPEPSFQFTAISSSGKLPAALYAPNPRRLSEPRLGGPYETADDFMKSLETEIARLAAAGDGMAEMRGGFRKVFVEQGASAFLPDLAEARRITDPIKTWLLGGTRDSIEDFQRLQRAGSAYLLRGRVASIEQVDGAPAVRYADVEGIDQTAAADLVINCSGPGRSFQFDPLTQTMIDKGWIKICPVSNGIEVGQSCRTTVTGLRHLSPATTVIGGDVMAFPLYDAGQLKGVVEGICR